MLLSETQVVRSGGIRMECPGCGQGTAVRSGCWRGAAKANGSESGRAYGQRHDNSQEDTSGWTEDLQRLHVLVAPLSPARAGGSRRVGRKSVKGGGVTDVRLVWTRSLGENMRLVGKRCDLSWRRVFRAGRARWRWLLLFRACADVLAWGWTMMEVE